MITDAPEDAAVVIPIPRSSTGTRICKECGDDIDPFDSRLPDKQPYALTDLCGQCFSVRTMTLPPVTLNGTPSGGTYTIVEDGERSGPFPAEPPAIIEPTMDNPHNPAIRSMELPSAFDDLNDNGRWLLETYGLDPKKVYKTDLGPAIFFEQPDDVRTHAIKFAAWICKTGVQAWAVESGISPLIWVVECPPLLHIYFEPAPALETTDGPDEVTIFGEKLPIAKIGDVLEAGTTYAVEAYRVADMRRYEQFRSYERCRLTGIGPLSFEPVASFQSLAEPLSAVLGPATSTVQEDGSIEHRWPAVDPDDDIPTFLRQNRQRQGDAEAFSKAAKEINDLTEARRLGCMILLGFVVVSIIVGMVLRGCG
jgi:hypothetical protein